MKYYYVYRITNKVENKHYYGKRTSNIQPNDDLGKIYFSSSTDLQFIKDQKLKPHNYRYKIIKIFTNSKDATFYEIFLHEKFNVGLNEKFYNKCKQTSVKFDTNGIKFSMSDEGKKKISDSKKNSEGNNKNTLWITCIETGKNRRIKGNSSIPSGWKEGRNSRCLIDKKFIYNEETLECKTIDKNTILPEGWKYGIIRQGSLETRYVKHKETGKKKLLSVNDKNIPHNYIETS